LVQGGGFGGKQKNVEKCDTNTRRSGRVKDWKWEKDFELLKLIKTYFDFIFKDSSTLF